MPKDIPLTWNPETTELMENESVILGIYRLFLKQEREVTLQKGYEKGMYMFQKSLSTNYNIISRVEICQKPFFAVANLHSVTTTIQASMSFN